VIGEPASYGLPTLHVPIKKGSKNAPPDPFPDPL
jgi:hypothetical protein